MIKNEPVLTSGIVVALIGAAIALATTFGLNFTKDQVSAILGFVTVAAPVVAALHGRAYVTPMATLSKKILSIPIALASVVDPVVPPAPQQS